MEEFSGKYDKLVELIGTLVEFRNPENQLHVQRMRGLAKIMCKTMLEMYPDCGLTDESIQYIVTGCALHDVGKIAIPESIILKPGRLTDDEYEMMKSHPLRGIDVIDSVKGAFGPEFEKVLREMVHFHHEKYDGGGYPEGLKGDEIPLSAQIVALADTYDALVNDRVYKKAFSKEEAFNMIIIGDCGVFPPKILECFGTCREKLEAWENGELKFEEI